MLSEHQQPFKGRNGRLELVGLVQGEDVPAPTEPERSAAEPAGTVPVSPHAPPVSAALTPPTTTKRGPKKPAEPKPLKAAPASPPPVTPPTPRRRG